MSKWIKVGGSVPVDTLVGLFWEVDEMASAGYFSEDLDIWHDMDGDELIAPSHYCVLPDLPLSFEKRIRSRLIHITKDIPMTERIMSAILEETEKENA